LLDHRHSRKHGDPEQRERAEQHEPPVRRPDSTLQGVVDLTHYGLDFSRAGARWKAPSADNPHCLARGAEHAQHAPDLLGTMLGAER
uniref:hypothetical protein n=1 Tax=Klebsiella pneumoniae TaxID=573 RepID=UPI0013D4E9A0